MKVLRNASSFSCTNYGINHKFEQISRSLRDQTPTKIGLDRKGKLQWKFTKLPIIASTFPVITAGNLKANRLHCLSILFLSTSEMFREGVILPQRLGFRQSFINDRTTLNLLCFVAYS